MPDARSPEDTLAWHFMQRAQAAAPPGDARRSVPTQFDRRAAHEAMAALRAAGWRVIRAVPVHVP
jgi:hypothetical protein